MNVMEIVSAAGVIGLTGLFTGVLLGVAGKIFAVPADEREQKIRAALPGNNCGGCGYAGCDALAEAIAAGKASADSCPVGGTAAAGEIARIMGVAVKEQIRRTAFVKCKGTCDKTEIKYHYYGIGDCRKLELIPGRGGKKCTYGCMGLGSCVRACPFDAIHVVNGIARVDREACRACGKCIAVCPNHLIEMIPYSASCAVACSSPERGREVKAACRTGCIGCGLCERQCEYGAIVMSGSLAYINQELCTGCGKCMEKCPVHIIASLKLDESA